MNDDSGADRQRPAQSNELVFVVEDDAAIADVYVRFLARFGYRVRSFPSAIAALPEIQTAHPGLVITDKDMAGMSGLQLAEQVRATNPDVRFIMVTGVGSEASAQAALRLGITDYLTKPVDLYELARSAQRAFTARTVEDFRRSTHDWLLSQVDAKTQQIKDVTLGALGSLVNALEARNPHFKGHSQSVSLCAAAIAREMGLGSGDVDAIRIGGLLHDIGMIGVPDSVLSKPDALGDDERQLIQTHPRKGAEILEPLTHLGSSITYVVEHHERLNGSGYPLGKSGDAISMGGQIVGLAEAWTALREVRAHRNRLSEGDAMATLAAASGKWFAPELIEALRRTIAP